VQRHIFWISALVSGKLFDLCYAVLFWGDYLVFIADEWMNSRAGLYVVKKEVLFPAGHSVSN